MIPNRWENVPIHVPNMFQSTKQKLKMAHVFMCSDPGMAHVALLRASCASAQSSRCCKAALALRLVPGTIGAGW